MMPRKSHMALAILGAGALGGLLWMGMDATRQQADALVPADLPPTPTAEQALAAAPTPEDDQAAEPAISIPETPAQQDFRRMSVGDPEPTVICEVPDLPEALRGDINQQEILQHTMRILAVEAWQETGSCECPMDNISWEQAQARIPALEEELVNEFESKLRSRKVFFKAYEMEKARKKACGF